MNKALQALGLSMRAGACISGESTVIEAVRSGKAKLVLVAEDASKSTAKKMKDKCTFYNVPIYQCFTRERLGSSTGKGERVSIAITDAGFAKMIEQCLGNTAEVNELD